MRWGEGSDGRDRAAEVEIDTGRTAVPFNRPPNNRTSQGPIHQPSLSLPQPPRSGTMLRNVA